MTEGQDTTGTGGGPTTVVPPGADEVRQSPWSWWWSGAPWIALAILFGALDPGAGLFIFALALGVAVTIPRYLMWRKTIYYITGDGVVFQRGLLGTPQMYYLPAESFQRIVERPGIFGRLLGYHAVDIRMREGGRVSLAYVPASSNLTDRLIRLRDKHSDYDEQQELHELAMIEARQRGEEIPFEWEQDQPPAEEEQPDEQPYPEAEAEPEPMPDRPERRGRSSPTQATQYRPNVTGYDPKLGRGDKGREKDRGR